MLTDREFAEEVDSRIEMLRADREQAVDCDDWNSVNEIDCELTACYEVSVSVCFGM